MNKPLPWNVKGVGFDAREAARLAAKRAGVPLGDWLNDVIAARAAELGVKVDDVEADDRLEAIAARLSEDEAPTPSSLVPPRADRTVATPVSASAPAKDAVVDDLPQPSRRSPASLLSRGDPRQPFFGRFGKPAEVTRSPLPSHAVPTAEVAQAASLHGDTTIAAPSATAETRDAAISARLDKRDPVRTRKTTEAEAAQLDARLATILKKLNHSFAAAEELGAPSPSPKSETPGPSDAAPNAAVGPQPVPPVPALRSEPKGRVEAMGTRGAGDPPPDDSFADLHAAFKDLASKLDRETGLPQAAEARSAATDLAAEIAALGRRVDRLRAPAQELGRGAAGEVQSLRREMAQLSANLSQLAPQQSLASLEAAVRELAGRVDLSKLDGVQGAVLAPVERLGREMREAIRTLDAAPAVEALRRDMTSLGAKVDTLHQRDADPKTVETLRHDLRDMREAIGTLTERLGTAERLEGEVVALGDRVSALAERTSPAVARDLGAAVGDIRTLLHSFAEDGLLGALDQKIDRLATRVDTLAAPQDPNAFLDDLTRHIDRAHEGLVQRLAPMNGGSDLAALNDRIGALSGKIDAVNRSSHDVNALYGLVGNLADRLEAARSPQAGADTLNALQTQIGTLVERLDRTASSDTALQGLERLIGDLFLQIEQSRNVAIDAAENAARAAAQDTLRAAMDNPALNGAELTVQTGLDVDHVSQELAELRRVQEASDRRVNTTLTALNTTLERLVDRLVADSGAALAPAAAEAAGQAPRRRGGRTPPEPSVGNRGFEGAVPAFDPEQFLLEPGSTDARSRARKTAAAEVAAAEGRSSGAALSTEVGPLIAAARRAAQAAQASALEASLRVDAPADTGAKAPAGKTRSFFASKRRALLLGLAGLVLLAGTLQIVRLSTGHDADAGSTAPEPSTDTPASSEPKAAAPETPPAAAAAPAKPEVAPPAATPPTPGNGASLLAPPASPDKVAAGFAAPAKADAAPAPAVSDPALAGLSQGLKSLAANGNAAAQFEVGARLQDGRGVTRDAKQAFVWFQRAAQQGSAPAQYRLGSLYEKGVGVTADPALAVAWYEKAAGQGNVRAMHNLAVMSAEGAGGKPDYGKAVTWFTKAASYGVRDSQFNLAVLFARGLGVPQSLSQSYAWFAVAAQQGDADAVMKRDTVAGKLDPKALADAKATVASFHPLTPDAASNDIVAPPGGWDAIGADKTAADRTNGRKSEARISSM